MTEAVQSETVPETEPAALAIAPEILDAARRGCAQVEGRPWPGVTTADQDRYDGYFRSFIREVLPPELVERLINPNAPTWEERVRTALKGIFNHAFNETVSPDDNDPDFRVLVSRIRRLAERDDTDEVDVILTIAPAHLNSAPNKHNPVAFIATCIEA